MHCPYCRNTDTRVLDSRVAEDGGSIRFSFDGEKLSVAHEGRAAEGETHG